MIVKSEVQLLVILKLFVTIFIQQINRKILNTQLFFFYVYILCIVIEQIILYNIIL